MQDLNPKEARKLALCENLGREDLSCMDQAEALGAYAEDYRLSVNAAAKELGISGTTRSRLQLIINAPKQLREHEFSARAAEIVTKLERHRPGFGLKRAELFAEQKTTLGKMQRKLAELDRSAPAKRGRKRKSIVKLRLNSDEVELQVKLVSLASTEEEENVQEAVEAMQQCLDAISKREGVLGRIPTGNSLLRAPHPQ